MQISVTQHDIDTGVPLDPCKCAIGLALLRQTGETCEVRPEDRMFLHGPVNSPDCTKMPVEAVRWAMRFDAGLPVEPFAFEIEFEKEPE